jgi:hypothetical protein
MNRTASGPAHCLDQVVAGICAASAEALRMVADLDEQGAWKADGATSMSPWLAARYGLGWGTARDWVRVARALRRIPKIAEAYDAGRLSWDQLKPLTRFAMPDTDALWARKGPTWRPSSLHREADRHRKLEEREVADARAVRSLATWWDQDMRLLYLEGTLPAEEGAAVQAALEARAQEVVLVDSPLDPAGARLADAFVELVTGGSEGAAGAVLVVHADAEVLAGSDPDGPVLAETEGGIRLTSDAVRRMACDAGVEWVAESGGRPVGIGRRSRHIPPKILRLIRHRDVTCRFPGCNRRSWLKAHHLVHWADGGPTDLDNLALLCHAHHTLLHEGGWHTSGHPAGDLRFHDPGGRTLRSFAELTSELARAG